VTDEQATQLLKAVSAIQLQLGGVIDLLTQIRIQLTANSKK
jgi:hypothetical protein